MPVMDSIKAIGHGIGWLIPGVQEAQAMEASANAHRQRSLNDAINRAIQYETANPRGADEDPDYKDRLTRLFDMQGKVQQMGPFDNPKSLGGQFWHDYVSLHPDALMPGQPRQPKVTATPGPPTQGQPAGQPNLSVQIPGIDQATGGAVQPGMPKPSAPGAAMPGTSPVSPQAQAAAATAIQPQGGGSSSGATFPQLPEPPQVAGIGDQGSAGSPASFRTDVTALGGPPALTLPQRPSPIHMPVSLSGDVSAPIAQASMASQEPYINAQASTEQALNTLRGTTEFQMAEAPRKLEMIKQAIGSAAWDALDKIPGFKTELVSAVYGVQIPGIGQMYTPRTLSPGATGADWKKKYPGPETDWMDEGTVYEEKYSPMQGHFFEPKFVAPFQVQMAGGTAGTAPKTMPGAPATAIPGTIAPALVTPQTQTEVQPTPGGGQQTVKTEQKTVGGPGAAGPKAGPTAPKATTPIQDVTVKTDTFGRPISPARKSQIDNAVRGLLTENMSTAQMNEKMKLLEGSDKWLADQVRARFALVDQQPAMSWDLSMAQRAQFSNQALTHMDSINTLISKLDSDGKLGPLMSRWEDFRLGKWGAGDPDYARLRNQIDLMTKALGVVHGGARGGGSIQMYQSFLDKINPKIMDANTLRAALGTEKEWLDTYANPSKTAGVNAPSKAPQVLPMGLPGVGDTFGGSKVKAVTMVQ